MKKISFIIFIFLLSFLIGCNKQPKEVEITFIGMNEKIIEKTKYLINDIIFYPIPVEEEGYEFIGWDKELEFATEDDTVSAIYKQLEFVVKFYDQLGNLIEKQTVKYNENAIAPKMNEIKYYTFKGWDKDIMNVKSNLDVYPVYEKKETYSMTDYHYWLQSLSLRQDVNEILLTQQEIENYNQTIIDGYNLTGVVDVCNIEDNITGNVVKSYINEYNFFDKYNLYNNDTKQALNQTEKEYILNNTNINNILENIEVKFGIITNFAWLRSYPTNHYASSYTKDMFQETSLNVGEGVAIYHESLDNNWYFVQAQNYRGWVEKENVGVCNKQQLQSFLNNENKIVVISDYLIIENVHVRMGQAFPLVSENDNNCVIDFPIRNDGLIEFKQVEIKKDNNVNKGYLQYTYENIFIQAFKLLGINYSWGDKQLDGRDCSSTQNAVLSCFGFKMPRNTTEQRSIPNYGVSVKGITGAYMTKLYMPGTLIFSSGHVMMYIGEDENGIAYIFHNTSAGASKCILQQIDNYGGHKIIGILKTK